DVTVPGPYEDAENGDFANWTMAGPNDGGIAGEMDLDACPKHVRDAMEQVPPRDRPRLVERCAIPAAEEGVGAHVIATYELFEIALAEAFLFHHEFNCRDRIRSADRIVLGFIRLNQGRQNLHLILLGTAWLRVPQLLDRSQCSAVLGFGSDRTDFHRQLSHS